MSTEKSFSGGRAVGKTNWDRGIGNGVKVRSYAESNTCEIEVVGEYATVTQPETGDDVPNDYLSLLPAASQGKSWKVMNSSLSGETGGMGTLHISCVQVDAYNAFDETWEINMSEVSRSLKQHPKIISNSLAVKIIRCWEGTPEAIRSNGTSFWYYDVQGGIQSTTPVLVEDTDAINYLRAYIAGIETYNVYLPIVTRTTKYISIVDSNEVPYSDKIGKYDTPSVKPEGYTGSNKWFKSGDRYSRSPNGVWTRTEEWTYTDDTSHAWIYTEVSSSNSSNNSSNNNS